MDNKTKFKKGDICWIEDYQDFGECLIELRTRYTKNVKGGKLKEPIWDGRIISNNYPNFMEGYTNKDRMCPCHLTGAFENKLILIGGKQENE